MVELKRSGSSGGAFQPFHKEERVGKTSELLSKETPSPTVATVTSNNVGSSGREEKDGQRKQRRCWSQELHKRFLQSLQQLGGADCEYLILIYTKVVIVMCSVVDDKVTAY